MQKGMFREWKGYCNPNCITELHFRARVILANCGEQYYNPVILGSPGGIVIIFAGRVGRLSMYRDGADLRVHTKAFSTPQR